MGLYEGHSFLNPKTRFRFRFRFRRVSLFVARAIYRVRERRMLTVWFKFEFFFLKSNFGPHSLSKNKKLDLIKHLVNVTHSQDFALT